MKGNEPLFNNYELVLAGMLFALLGFYISLYIYVSNGGLYDKPSVSYSVQIESEPTDDEMAAIKEVTKFQIVKLESIRPQARCLITLKPLEGDDMNTFTIFNDMDDLTFRSGIHLGAILYCINGQEYVTEDDSRIDRMFADDSPPCIYKESPAVLEPLVPSL